MSGIFKKGCFSGALTVFLTVFSFAAPAGAAPALNVMGPLLVGDPTHIESPDSLKAWSDLKQQLQTLKRSGVQGISTDIWWGLIEANGPGQFRWEYYDKLAETIRDAGLRWIPILSFHQLGGNVGDTGYAPLPDWVWSEYRRDPQAFQSAADLMFQSEQGHLSKEYVSVWATDLILEDYKRVMESFKTHFAKYSFLVDEINISLGPSGELRYPSYNSHDSGSGYPTRGALQAYSRPAIQSFQNEMANKYRTIERLNQAWGFHLATFNEVFPPNPDLLKGPFWQNQEQFSTYGKDFFTWYNQSLTEHGSKVFRLANSVFGSNDSAFKGAALGGKIPGIHWRVASDRLAELAAGLIRSSYDDWFSSKSGYGYKETLQAFNAGPGQMKRTLHFTALEMDDYRDGEAAQSRAKALVSWIAQAAHSMNIEIKGENALAGELSNPRSWDNMFEALAKDGYSGLTLLRSNEIIADAQRTDFLLKFSQRLQTTSPGACSKIF